MRLKRVREAGAQLAAAGGRLKLFACHHPLREVEGEKVAGGVRRGDAASAILARAEVDLILTGHLHLPFALPLPYGDGRTYAVEPEPCRCGRADRRRDFPRSWPTKRR